MHVVYKYKLNLNSGETKLDVPVGAEILTTAFQGDKLYIWVKIDTTNYPETRIFNTFYTGLEILDALKFVYINTSFLPTGLVCHVFERIQD